MVIGEITVYKTSVFYAQTVMHKLQPGGAKIERNGPPSEIRTHTVWDLKPLPPAIWATGGLVRLLGFEPKLDALSTHCLYQLGYKRMVVGVGFEPTLFGF